MTFYIYKDGLEKLKNLVGDRNHDKNINVNLRTTKVRYQYARRYDMSSSLVKVDIKEVK